MADQVDEAATHLPLGRAPNTSTHVFKDSKFQMYTPSQIPNSQFNTQSEKSNHVEEAVWEMLRLPHPPAAAPTSAGNQGVQN